MDITLHIILKPADHALEGIRAASRLAKCDIIDVYKAEKYATLQDDGNYLLDSPPLHPRFGFVHIKNVPDILKEINIKNKLLEAVEILGQPVRRKKWHIPPSILPDVVKKKILTDKEITVQWAIAKSYIRKKTTPVILNPSQDDISGVLTDGDVS